MALAGDHIVVILDDSAGTPRTFANGDIQSVDLGLTFDQHDVTGFGDEVHKFINGQIQAPVTIKGFLTTDPTIGTGTHPVIQGAFAAQSQVTLEVQVGQNAPPVNGDPKFTGEFIVSSYKPEIATGGAVMFTATLNPAIGSTPAWGVVGS
jgi:hypothetical protein